MFAHCGCWYLNNWSARKLNCKNSKIGHTKTKPISEPNVSNKSCVQIDACRQLWRCNIGQLTYAGLKGDFCEGKFWTELSLCLTRCIKLQVTADFCQEKTLPRRLNIAFSLPLMCTPQKREVHAMTLATFVWSAAESVNHATQIREVRPSPNFGPDFALAPPACPSWAKSHKVPKNHGQYMCVCMCVCVCMCKVIQLRRHAQVVDRSKSPGLKWGLVLQTFEVVFSWQLRILYENDRPQVHLQGKLCCRGRQSITGGLTKRKRQLCCCKILAFNNGCILWYWYSRPKKDMGKKTN